VSPRARLSQIRKTHKRGTACQQSHLANGDGVQLLETFSLGQAHLDELRIQTLHVRQHEKLLYGSAIPHISVESGIRVAPLFGGLAKKSHVEKVGFTRVSTGGLRCANHSWDEVGLYRVGMDPVVEFRERAVQIPCKGKASVLVFLETLEFLDEVKLEFH